MRLITLPLLCLTLTVLGQDPGNLESHLPGPVHKLVGGNNLPDLVLSSADGTTVSTATLIGKPIMINFWSVGCIPCIEEIPHLNALKSKYGEDVAFLALTADDKENVQRFLMKNPFEFEIFSDAGKIFEEYSIKSIPFNLFIDAGGRIVYTRSGIPTKHEPGGGRRIDVVNAYGELLEELTRLSQKN